MQWMPEARQRLENCGWLPKLREYVRKYQLLLNSYIFPVEYFILVDGDLVEYDIASFVTGNQRAVYSDERSLPKGSYAHQ